MKPSPRPRLVVLGLDGLPFSTAVRLCREGHLPHLSTLALAPLARSIRAELPELSPVNWTSFFTASGPEVHGIYGFTSLDPLSYVLRFTDFTQVRAPTIFKILGDSGFTSRVVNLPNTFPARPIRGMFVAGFVAPDLHRAVYPPFLARQLISRGYILEADTEHAGHDPACLLESLEGTLRGRRAALDPGRIYLHTSNFARGGVQPDESERLREELRSELLTVTWQGNPVMQSVVRGREVYSGAAVPPAPDLLCVPRPGFSLRAKFDRAEIFGMAHRRGCHTADDAFFTTAPEPSPAGCAMSAAKSWNISWFRRPLPKLPAALKPRDAPRAKDAAGVLPLV